MRGALPYLAVLAAALGLLLFQQDYWTVIATRAAIYWVLVAGLNLVVGFAGQLAIGYVALLTLGPTRRAFWSRRQACRRSSP